MEPSLLFWYYLTQYPFFLVRTCGANVEQINTLYKSKNLASYLLSASCEILNDFKSTQIRGRKR